MKTSDTTVPVSDDGLELLKRVALQSENTTGFVFHGASQVIQVLEPRPVYWKDPHGLLYDDSKGPVVCASDKPFIPAFMALIPREANWGYVSNGNADGLTYYIERSFKEKFMHATGYVMALSSESFHKTVPDIPEGWNYDLPVGGRQPEMRSEKAIVPLFAVKVTYADFEELVRLEGHSVIEYR